MTVTAPRAETTFESSLWDIIDDRMARLAPLYAPLLDGTMSRASLKHWAGQLYVENRPFVQVLGAILADCDDRDAQAFLADDLFEETGRGEPSRNHVTIVGRFAVACGHDPDRLDAIPASPATSALLAYYRSLSSAPWVEAVAAVGIGLEGSFLARADRAVDATNAGVAATALQEHFGFDADDVEFFLLHDVTDVEHTRRALDIVNRMATTTAQQAAVVERVTEMAEHVTEWAASVFEEAVSG